MFSEEGPRTSGSVRAAFPKVNGAGCENTDVLKYFVSRCETGPLSAALWPLLLGRSVLMPQFVQVFGAVTEIGNPVW